MAHARAQTAQHAASAETILESLAAGVLCLDREGRITFANPAAARLLGFLAGEDLIGQPIRTYIQFMRSAAVPEAAEAPALSLGGMTLLPLGEEVCWAADGGSFPIEYETSAQIEGGRLTGAVITLRDVSRRRSAERRKDELISVTSHELRTPLTSIRSALGLLAGGVVGELPVKGRRMLEIAITNSDRLIRLVNDILDLERIEAGQPGEPSVECDARDLMSVAVDGVRSVADQHGVRIEVTPIDARLWGEPDRLVQVLTNLLANAIRFSPVIGGTVWLDAERSATELVIRVRDEGRGIPAAKLEVIFDRFVQVDASDARDKGGSGLGLTISKGIVQQHGGQIWAESTVGVGTTVCVALPLAAGGAPRALPMRDDSLSAA